MEQRIEVLSNGHACVAVQAEKTVLRLSARRYRYDVVFPSRVSAT